MFKSKINKRVVALFLCFSMVIGVAYNNIYAKNVPNVGNTSLKFTDLEKDDKAYSVAYMYYDIWRDGYDDNGKPIPPQADDNPAFWSTDKPESFQTAIGGYNFKFEGRKIKSVKVRSFIKNNAEHEQIWAETRSTSLNYDEFAQVHNAAAKNVSGIGTDTVQFSIHTYAKLIGGYDGKGYTTMTEPDSKDPSKMVYGRRYYFPIVVEVDLEPIDDGGEVEPPIDLGEETIAGEDIDPQVTAVIKAENKGAEKFDVTKGIPSSEYIYVQANAKNYLYRYSFSKVVGEKTYPITVTETYTQHFTYEEEEYVGDDEDGNAMYETVTIEDTRTIPVSKSYEIPRQYAYWQKDELILNNLKTVTVKNDVLPKGEVVLVNDDTNKVQVTIDEVNDRIIDPTYNKVLDLGTTDIGFGDVPDKDFKGDAESAIGQIKVTNDGLTVGGKTVTEVKYIEKQTSRPNVEAIESNKLIELVKRNIQIKPTQLNGIYESKGSVEYDHGFTASVRSVSKPTPKVIDLGTEDIGFGDVPKGLSEKDLATINEEMDKQLVEDLKDELYKQGVTNADVILEDGKIFVVADGKILMVMEGTSTVK